MASLTLENGSLAFRTRYDPGLVSAFKDAVPSQDRRWDGNRKIWLVNPRHGQTLADLTQQYLHETVAVPAGQVTMSNAGTPIT